MLTHYSVAYLSRSIDVLYYHRNNSNDECSDTSFSPKRSELPIIIIEGVRKRNHYLIE